MMNFVRTTVAALALLLTACASAPVPTAAPAKSTTRSAVLPLIPMPAEVTHKPGQFTLHAGDTVRVASSDPEARAVARQFIARLARTRGLELELLPAGQDANDHAAIVFSLDPDNDHLAGEAAYRLRVTSAGIRVTAPQPRGLFYASITLWQLLTPAPVHGANTATVPALVIRDHPRFHWRGLLLDSVRHFQSVAEIKQLLELMAQHKLDVLHWHLTDDQGWRIQIKQYPKLTEIGAWRTPPGAGSHGEPLRYGGFYTQAEIREVVEFAEARYITVVPEIDMPGHAQAAVASYPWVGVTGERPEVSVDWGINPWLYGVDDDTFTFIENVLDEVMALFPSTYIHVGGDEAIKDQWRASPAVQAKMEKLGIDTEEQLQTWFINRVGRYLAAHGRRLIGWDEILEGGIPEDATVMSWRGTEGAIKAAKAGHDVVLSPSPVMYFDHVQSDLPGEISGRLGVIDLKQVYQFQPIPDELTSSEARHVLGAQANVWAEHLPSIQHVQQAVFPRIAALAEVLWTPRPEHNWASFLARMPAQLARYRAAGVAYSDSAFAAAIKVDRNAALASGSATVSLSSQTGFGQFRYTLDGSRPGRDSSMYQHPIRADLPVTVRVATFAPNGSLLARARPRQLDMAGLRSFAGTALPNCPASGFRLRVQPMPDATSLAPVYAINVFDSCWLVPPMALDGISHVLVDALRLPRNYALPHLDKYLVPRPAITPFGELVVRLDDCDGEIVARMPLPDPAHSPKHFSLKHRLAPQHGEHALCLIYTAPIDGPLYAIGRFSLQP